MARKGAKRTETEAPETRQKDLHQRIEDGWARIQEGMKTVVRLLDGDERVEFTPQEYMSLYTEIYNLCTVPPQLQKTVDPSKTIYEKYVMALEEHNKTTVLPYLMEKEDKACLLKDIVESWENYLLVIHWLSRFLDYIQRFFIPRHGVDGLKTTAVKCFHATVYKSIHVRAKDGALQLINQERDGEAINRSLLKNLVDLCMVIGLEDVKCYKDDLEAPILLDAADYCSRLASKHILVDSCSEYMIMAEQQLKLEEERALSCLRTETLPKLLKIARDKLLKDWVQQLLEKEHSGLRVILREHKVEDLDRMYRLFSCIDGGIEQIIAIFTQNIVEDGLSLIKQAQDDFGKKVDNKDPVGSPEVAFIRNVIELHDRQMGYVTRCFNDNTKFHKALKVAFESFCNKSIAGTDMSELLSNYVDHILKKGGGSDKSSDEAIEETIDKIVKLLVYIDNKDIFAEFCRKKLSRRLLFDRSANDEHERYVLSRLKQNNGGQFTSKMEGMVRDLQVARELQAEFANYPVQNQGMDLVVSVLTTGFWPTYKTYDLHLPAEMTKAVEDFKMFYNMKTKSRKLTWVFSMGTCLITGKFSPKPIELMVTTPQAATLMLFNDSDRLSFKEIMEQLNLSEDDVLRLLHSLSCAKYKILSKEPNTKSIAESDTFAFNSKFTDRSRRIKVPLAPVDEKKKVIEDVEKDRRYSIDAAVVRIMKSRKVMGYQELIIECVNQLSQLFKPDVKTIKRRIEDLIERSYMERFPEDQNKFKYIA